MAPPNATDAFILVTLLISLSLIVGCLYLTRRRRYIWFSSIIPAVAGNTLAIVAAMYVYTRENDDRAHSDRMKASSVLHSDLHIVIQRNEFLLQSTGGSLRTLSDLVNSCAPDGEPLSESQQQQTFSTLQGIIPDTLHLMMPYEPLLAQSRDVLSLTPSLYSFMRFASASTIQSRGRFELASSNLLSRFHNAVNIARTRRGASIFDRDSNEDGKSEKTTKVLNKNHPVMDILCKSASSMSNEIQRIDERAREFSLLSCMLASALTEGSPKVQMLDRMISDMMSVNMVFSDLLKYRMADVASFGTQNGSSCVRQSGYVQ